MRKNQQNSFFNRPSSPIAVLEGFDLQYFEDKQENNNEKEDDERDWATTALANKEFLEKELVFNLKSSSNSGFKKSLVDLVSNDSNSVTIPNNSRNCQSIGHTLVSSSFSFSYA